MLVTTTTVAGCRAGPAPVVGHGSAVVGSVPSVAHTTGSPTATTTLPRFASNVSTVSTAQLGPTWHVGCPVDPSQLRLIQMDYWGFDGHPHRGSMVVNGLVVESVTRVFSTLFAAHFPMAEMIPVSTYNGSDDAAAAADDTSGFNCRYAVAPGPAQWSMHAYGEAIDVNDVQNPYLDGATVIPNAGGSYRDRADVRPGMAVPGGTLVDAFIAVGWQWGGRWTGTPDYQHFSVNGK